MTAELSNTEDYAAGRRKPRKSRKPRTPPARVLRAAANSFAEKGYYGASLREIADAVGMQAASLYNYVSGKQALLAEVMIDALERRHQAVKVAVEAEQAPAARLRAFARAHVQFQGEELSVAGVCLTELRSLEPDNAATVVQAIGDHERLLESILRTGLESGEFVVADLVATIRGFLDAWDGVAFWYRSQGPLALDQIGERYAKFALAAISDQAPVPIEASDDKLIEDENSTRNQIIRVATEMFAEHSYSGTTVRMLAQRAGVQPSVIYHYFGSKEGLLYEILSAVMRAMLSEVRGAMSSAARPPDQLAAWIRAHVRLEGSSKYKAIVSDAELNALSERHRAVVVAQRRDYDDLLTTLIEEGRAEGFFHVQSPRLTAFAIARMCSGVGQWGSSSDPERIGQLGDRYAELILAGLGYRQPVPAVSSLN